MFAGGGGGGGSGEGCEREATRCNVVVCGCVRRLGLMASGCEHCADMTDADVDGRESETGPVV